MGNRKNFFLLFIIPFFLISCGGVDSFKKAVTGTKETTTDEFLIKKKDPLILPPEYEKLPLPGNDRTVKESQDSLKSILDKEKDISKNSKDISDLENQVLREIRKNNQ